MREQACPDTIMGKLPVENLALSDLVCTVSNGFYMSNIVYLGAVYTLCSVYAAYTQLKIVQNRHLNFTLYFLHKQDLSWHDHEQR